MIYKLIKLFIPTLISLSLNAELKEASVVITTDYVIGKIWLTLPCPVQVTITTMFWIGD